MERQQPFANGCIVMQQSTKRMAEQFSRARCNQAATEGFVCSDCRMTSLPKKHLVAAAGGVVPIETDLIGEISWGLHACIGGFHRRPCIHAGTFGWF